MNGHVRKRRRARCLLVVAVACVAAAVLGAGQPAVATSHAGVTAGEALAYNYYVDVSLFGQPAERRGHLQPDAAPASASSPSAACPAGGGSDGVTDPDGARATFGPVTIFGGLRAAANDISPPSGPLTSAVDCQLGENGSVSASTSVTRNPQGTTWTTPGGATRLWPGGVGPNLVLADEVHSSCTLTPDGLSSGVTIADGRVITSTTPDTGLPATTEQVPDNPPPGHEVAGTIDVNGDSFRVVFNEQVENEDGSFTVNAVHAYLLGPTVVGDMVIGSTTCGPLAVEMGPDLSVDVTGPATVARGDAATYTVAITNTGGVVAPGVVLDSSLTQDRAGGARVVAAMPTQGACLRRGLTPTCALGVLAPGETAMVTMQVQSPRSPVATSMILSVEASSDGDDANPAGDADAHRTTLS